MRPVIGISSCFNYTDNRYSLGGDYVAAVEAAGGTPIILPNSPEIIDSITDIIDGLLLSGGGDVDPFFAGEEPCPENGCIDPNRDHFELALTKEALSINMPILGICRGMQVLNIAAGGNINQDIGRTLPSTFKHSQDAPRWYPTHGINVIPGTLLEKILGHKQTRVNSFHHQSINQVAPRFYLSAYSEDSVAEAIEAVDHNFALGVQFHPENMYARYPVMLNLFKFHIKASAGYAYRRKHNTGKGAEHTEE